MKKLFVSFIIGSSLLVIAPSIHAQDSKTAPDQRKLLHQLSGNWQRSLSKDTVEVVVTKHYGSAFISRAYYLVKGKKSQEYVENFAYDPDAGKIRGFLVHSNGRSETWIGSFTSEYNLTCYLTDNFNPDKILGKIEFITGTPKVLDVTIYDRGGNKTTEFKYRKIK